jgi:hypothetical protein
MAKQLTPAEIAAYMQALGLTPAPPTEAVGAKGSKPFVGDKKSTTSRQKSTEAYKSALKKRVPVQNMNDLSSPAWWAKNILAGGKSAVVDPLVKASKMDWLNPDSGLAPVERLNTLLGDALTVGSMASPVKGATTAGMGLYDDLAARMADRYMYGIHVSPYDDLNKIKAGSKFWMDKNSGGPFGDAIPGYSYFFNTTEKNPNYQQTVANLADYITAVQMNPRGANLYTVKVPKKGVSPDENFAFDSLMEELIGAGPSAVKRKGSLKIKDSQLLPYTKPRPMYKPDGESVLYIDPDMKKQIDAISNFAKSSAKLKGPKNSTEDLYKNIIDSLGDTPYTSDPTGLSIIFPKKKTTKTMVDKSRTIEQALQGLDEKISSVNKILNDLKTLKGGK